MIDIGTSHFWVVAEDLHQQAATAQAKVGLLVRVKTKATAGKDDPGVPTASPYINIINQQAKIMLKAGSELGFTPVSRPRIGAGAPLLPMALERANGDRGQKSRPSHKATPCPLDHINRQFRAPRPNMRDGRFKNLGI